MEGAPLGSIIKVKDLDKPVVASKADWALADGWLGFTPTGKGSGAFALCQATIQKQFDNGLILERVTSDMPAPNAGFERDPEYLEDQRRYEAERDRIIAIHELRYTSRHARDIIGEDQYNRLQDMWANANNRRRWSVAFPIIRSWEFTHDYRAKDVFDPETYKKLYNYSTAGLRPLDDNARAQIAELTIREIPARGAWIAIEDEIKVAVHPENNIPSKFEKYIDSDFEALGALEGESDARKVRIKKRAAHLAYKFSAQRSKDGNLTCDHCGFTPETSTDLPKKYWRSCLDVHHKDPLAEGVRYTTLADFELLCPTCHRITHIKIRLNR